MCKIIQFPALGSSGEHSQAIIDHRTSDRMLECVKIALSNATELISASEQMSQPAYSKSTIIDLRNAASERLVEAHTYIPASNPELTQSRSDIVAVNDAISRNPESCSVTSDSMHDLWLRVVEPIFALAIRDRDELRRIENRKDEDSEKV